MELRNFLSRRNDELHILGEALAGFLKANDKYTTAAVALELSQYSKDAEEAFAEASELRKEACEDFIGSLERLFGITHEITVRRDDD